MEKLKIKKVNFKNIKNTLVSFCDLKKHQPSITKYSYYKDLRIFEETSNNPWVNGEEYYVLSIITESFINDTPMDINSLSKLKSSFDKDLDKIINSFPDSSRFVSDLEIIIVYNNYGSTFLEWKFYFLPKKIKKFKKKGGLNELYDFFNEFDYINYENIFETIIDIDLLNGDSLYDVVSNEDDNEIRCFFKNYIKINIEFGYELETIDYYVENYGIEKNIVEDVMNIVLGENVKLI
jgi:hypothetical protein